MSIYARPGDFLNFGSLPVAITSAELEVPKHDFAAPLSQPVSISVDEKYMVFSPGRRKVGHYAVRSWDADDHHGAVATLVNLFGGGTLYLTNYQLVTLEQQGRFKPYKSSGNVVNGGQTLALKDWQRESAEKWLGYVTEIAEAAQRLGRPADKSLILQVAADRADRLGDNPPPSYSRLRQKLAVYYENHYDPLVALAPQVPPGNRITTYSSLTEQLLEDAVHQVSLQTEGDWDDVKALFLKWAALPDNEAVGREVYDGSGKYRGPSDSTIQRRWGKVDKFVKYANTYGPGPAQEKFSIYIRQVLPGSALDTVDVDWTQADVTALDDVYPVFWERPWLCIFRDRCTAAVVGFAISFEGPSYIGTLAALKHAIYPKDMSAFPGLVYLPYGLPANVGVDLAMENLSENMRSAAAQLGFKIVEYRGSHGWEKGGVERAFRVINQDVLHIAPGSTFSNPQRRKEYDDAKNAGLPVLTLSELEAWLLTYFATKYHTRPVKGIGVLRSMKAIPNDKWAATIKHAPPRRPVDPLVFARLAGDFTYRTIQNDGILWDCLRYADPGLAVFTADPKHRMASDRSETTRYKCVRDPNDLARIWVVNHHVNPPTFIEVPVSGADAAYATGMTLSRHRAIQKVYRDRLKEDAATVTDLVSLRDTMTDEIRELNERRKAMRVKHSFERFFAGLKRKFARSRIVDPVHSAAASAERIRLDEPFEPAPANRSRIDAESRRGSTPSEIFSLGPEVNGDGHIVPISGDPFAGNAADVEPRARHAQAAPPAISDRTDTEARTSAADLFSKFHSEGEDE
ncbi:transposase family protein [Agrobacterium tumefaciens]|nr:transposase family protein [Agrobacterium tumefaciens]